MVQITVGDFGGKGEPLRVGPVTASDKEKLAQRQSVMTSRAVEAGASIDQLIAVDAQIEVVEATPAEHIPLGEEFADEQTSSLAIAPLVAPGKEAPVDAAVTFDDKTIDEYWESIRETGSDTLAPKKEEPSPAVQLGAAITAFSPTKAAVDILTERYFPRDPEFNFMEHMDEIKNTIHPDNWEALAESASEGELRHKMQKLSDEAFAVQTIFEGNKVIGGAAVVAALLADPTTLLGGAGELAALTKLASTSRRRNALTGAAVLGVSTAAQESLLATAQESMTTEDAVMGVLIGSTLGGGLGAMFKTSRAGGLADDVRRISSETRAERLGSNYGKDTGDESLDGYVAPVVEEAVGVSPRNAEVTARLDTLDDDADNWAAQLQEASDAGDQELIEEIGGVLDDIDTERAALETELDALNADAPVTGGSVGAARVDTDESAVDLSLEQTDFIDQAEQWAIDNDELLQKNLNSKTGKAIKKMADLGISMDSTFFLTAKSAVMKHFGATFLENGAGLGGRQKTAAIIKDFYERQMLSATMPAYRQNYATWLHGQGIGKLSPQRFGVARSKFDRLLREELEARRLNRSDRKVTNDASVADAADAWQKGMDHALDTMKKTGVRGADDIDRIPGYVPLKWDGGKLRRLPANERLQYKALLARGYMKSLDMDTESANLMADAVFQRAMRKDLQIDSNPSSLLNADARQQLREMLDAAGVDESGMEALFKKIDGSRADRGKGKNLRRRAEIDLNLGAGNLRLMDLVDNDMSVLAGRYMSETAGRSAMARKGITNDADWTTLRQTLLQDAAAKDPDIDIRALATKIDAIHSQLLGRPVGEGINKNARRLMDTAMLSMLGQVGFAQLAELATVTAQFGIKTMLEEIPSMKRLATNIRAGDADPDLLDEIAMIAGDIGEEHILFRPEVRLDDRQVTGGAWESWMQPIDKALAKGQDVLGYVSGMNHVKRLEQRLSMKVLTNKVAKLAMGEKVPRLTPERLADIGWDEKTISKITAAIRKHAVFNDNGTVKILNLANWNPNLTEDFVIGLNRFTHQVVQLPLVGETATWMHGTLGAMLTQFRHFPVVAMEKQLARNTMHGDMTTFSTISYGLAWSGAIYMAKSAINAPGQPDGWLEDRMAPDRIAKGAIQYAGMAALIPDGISVLAYAGIVPADWAFNAGRTGGHKQSALSMQTIPALGVAEDIFNTATTGTRMLWEDYDFGKKDVTAMQGATILGNTVPANIIFGLMKQAAE